MSSYQLKIKTDTSGNTSNVPLDAETLQGNSPSNFVSISGTQTISGAKTHTNVVKLNEANINAGAGLLYRHLNTSYTAGISYRTAGNEAVCFDNKNSVTSWMFRTKDPTSTGTSYTDVTPSMQIKNQRVTINKLIENGTDASYNLDVNGTSNATTLYENGTSLANKYTQASSTLTSNKVLVGNGNKDIKTTNLSISSDTYYDYISSQNSILIDTGRGESIYLGNDNGKYVVIGSQNNDETELRLYGYLANYNGSVLCSLPSSSGQLVTTNDLPEYSLGYSNIAQTADVRSNNSVTLNVPSGKVPLFLGYNIDNTDDIAYYGIYLYEAYIYKDSSGWKAYANAYDENGSIVDGYIDVNYILISVDEV